MRIRKVKNSVGNISIQVGTYQGKHFHLVKHIGSARNLEEETRLIEAAHKFISKDQASLFEKPINETDLVPLGYSRTKTYNYLKESFEKVFPDTSSEVLRDLTIIRIVKPTSKLESIELLEEYFGIKYSYASLYRALIQLNKDELVLQLVKYVQNNLSFDFSLLFYDVTTLYFESKPDEILRIPGFSKDGKHSQPQILIGLVVDSNGFPIYYEVFRGNSFEGHTMVPIIKAFKDKFKVDNLTIIADSAMLSEDNLLSLEAEGLNYIVGNRTITTYKPRLLQTIEKLKRKDNSTVEIRDKGRIVVYHYSIKREKKDLYEIEKALKKAGYLSTNPSKRLRAKYLKVSSQRAEINRNLVEKHRFLAGIKSYKTNTHLQAELIVERYSDLWKIEKSFRMTKHDLKARPIFHRKEDAIKAHIQIVFAANAVARHIELNTGVSIKQVVKKLMREINVRFKFKDSDRIYSLNLTPH